MKPEYADYTVVTCDGKHALVDLKVWDEVSDRLVDARVSYTLGDARLTPEHGLYYDLASALADDPVVLTDVREAVMVQRDALRELN